MEMKTYVGKQILFIIFKMDFEMALKVATLRSGKKYFFVLIVQPI